jgi:hypothetical protein
MIARCANPDCNHTFRMWEGKVYHFDRKVEDVDGSIKLVGDHYWLCQACSPTMSLELAEEGLVLKTTELVAVDETDLVPA